MNASFLLAATLPLVAIITPAAAKEEAWIEPLKAEGLAAFQEPTGKWGIFGKAEMNPNKTKNLNAEAGTGILHNAGRTNNILTKHEHGDVELEIEFMVPKGSNSGVYFQGRYEIQVFDSWGVDKPQHSDCGGIYQRWVDKKGFEGHPPRENASKKPGEWQKFEVLFQAPRFDAEGNKTANAKFVKVVHNGVVVHENVELTGPTRSAKFKDEKALGPLMLQGDHGPVAYRNLRIKPLTSTQ